MAPLQAEGPEPSSSERRCSHPRLDALDVQRTTEGRSGSAVLVRFPEPGMRQRALSSGLIARDQVTCALQATTKSREPKHDNS